MIDDKTYNAYKKIDQKSMNFLFYYAILKKEREEQGLSVSKLEKEELAREMLKHCYFSI